MKEFEIRLTSVEDVQEFVSLATTRPFPIVVKNRRRQLTGKGFMEMFCLDFTRPITVTADCSEAEWEAFRAEARRFLVNP